MATELSQTATISLASLAADLDVSEKTVRRMIHSARIPKPMRLNGSSFRWLTSEIRLWLELGMPDRSEFERLKAEQVTA
jgi:predicted DNA-binding transcriptional regulator AlpA